MVARNRALFKMEHSYLFEEIARRTAHYKKEELIHLGIGDTTRALPPPIIQALQEASGKLGCESSYSGYESCFGRMALRIAIAETLYEGRISPEEVFISDGSKCDIARIQQLFAPHCSVAIQDPSYPAYIGATLLSGKEKILYMPCNVENGFCPEPLHADVIYLCSPNNPTGHAMNHEQIATFVTHAKKHSSFIIFDTAYAAFIQDPTLPRSIYEIEDSKEVAIETGSFSKMFGFTGLRLSWLIVPKELRFEGGASVRDDWIKISSTSFNGASNLAQAGGLAALSAEGMRASQEIIAHYMRQAQLLKRALPYVTYGGEHAPYLWIDLKGRASWEVFDELLERKKIVTTPGVGFGAQGEGFLRLSAFAKANDIAKALTIWC